MNKKIVSLFSFIFISIIILMMPCFGDPIEEYKNAAHNRIEKQINQLKKNEILYSWKGEKERIKINKGTVKVEFGSAQSKKYPTPIGAEYTIVTYNPEKLPVYNVNTPYAIKEDNEGRRALAYVDVDTKEPIIATYGFYVVKKEDPFSRTVRNVKYCVDGTGYMISGWFVEQDNTRYYLSENEENFGEAIVGNMIFSDGKTYSFDENGVLHEFDLKNEELVIEE